MKTILLFFILTPFICSAQTITTKKNGGEKQADYYYASAGVSISQDRHMYPIDASTGPIISLGYHSFFNKRWGMGLGLNGSLYKSKAVNRYSSVSGNMEYASTSAQNWQKAQTYISFSYTPVLRKYWAIDIVQSFGLYYIKQPAYEYYNYIYSNYNYYNYAYYNYRHYSRTAKKDWDTGYNICLRARVLLKNNIGLFASANFFRSLGSPSYKISANRYRVNAFDTVDWTLGIIVNLKK